MVFQRGRLIGHMVSCVDTRVGNWYVLLHHDGWHRALVLEWTGAGWHHDTRGPLDVVCPD